MEVVFSILVGVVAFWVAIHIVAAIFFILRAQGSTLEELRHVQGSLANIFVGKLNNQPEISDYRVVNGLEWDEKEKKYKPQSRLSIESIKAAFFG